MNLLCGTISTNHNLLFLYIKQTSKDSLFDVYLRTIRKYVIIGFIYVYMHIVQSNTLYNIFLEWLNCMYELNL